MIVEEQAVSARQAAAEVGSRGELVGCVPTMGALHAGHMSLIQAARKECTFVVVTIFVNPSQFGPQEDLAKYPRPLERDLEQCSRAGVDLVFVPTVASIYPAGFATWVEVERLSSILEGACRPGHFRGVTTIVLKLLNIIQPAITYFGQKDFQQQLIVRKMCEDLDLPIRIRTCPTIREADGLALSSRNVYLSPEERKNAVTLWQALQLARDQIQAGETDVGAVRRAMRERLTSVPGISSDYATVADAHTLEDLSSPRREMVALVAARVGVTRLIDNLPIGLTSSP